jgi:hypothetical protein
MVALVPSRHLNIVHLLTDIRDLVVNAVHFMKKLIYHENTKVGKHEIFLGFYFRALKALWLIFPIQQG